MSDTSFQAGPGVVMYECALFGIRVAGAALVSTRSSHQGGFGNT
jgi:hypothetical protein